MTFPADWSNRFALTIDKTKVTGTPTGFILLVTKDMFPTAAIDASGSSAQDGGGDIRFTNDAGGSQLLPIDVVDFHPDAISGNRRCEIWVNMSGFEPTSAADKTIYCWYKAAAIKQQPAPSIVGGKEAVWSSLDYRAVHHMNESHKPEATGLWLIRPKAVEFNGATYITWQDQLSGGNGNVRVAKYTHSTGVWSTAVTVAATEVLDGHGAPSICVDISGFIHITWGAFSGASGALKTVKSTVANSIATWDAVVTIASGLTEATYPCMLCLSTGVLVLFDREADNWTRRVSSDNGTTWVNAQQIVNTPRAYTEWILGPSDRVHVAWHTTASAGSINGLNLYYAYTDNPSAATSTWKAADGTTLSLPVQSDFPTTVSGGRVYSTSGGGFDTSYLLGLAVDGSNNPMICAGLFVAATPASNRISSFTYAAGTWTKVDIFQSATTGLSTSPTIRVDGGVRFLTGTTWRALTSTTVSGKGEVQEYETINGGTSWNKVADVTLASSLGNYQAQYVRGSTGPIVATHFSTVSANNLGTAWNTTNDIWYYGTHTDYKASWADKIIAAAGFLRDSTKYHNDGIKTGAPTAVTSPMPFGGVAMQYNGAQNVSIADNASINAGLTPALTVNHWVKHNSAGTAEKTANKNPGAGNTTPWVLYRDGSNNAIVFFGNGSAFVAPTSAGGATTTAYRFTAQFSANTGSARLNKTAIGGLALTGPLAVVADPINMGETLVGQEDEFRITPTILSANLLDTEYDNQSSPATFASNAPAPISTGRAANSLSMSYRVGI